MIRQTNAKQEPIKRALKNADATASAFVWSAASLVTQPLHQLLTTSILTFATPEWVEPICLAAATDKSITRPPA